ncbi:DUF5666 domain-containing protein [Candidatus Villigracilis saccharophilus]|uniref:DUF5666 domain-containing protein n=1 Tax=Candidatus Villigracilis saccharophilus TaxID=3140684 RepID=UPI003137035B|nr:hypothetical protein [Anaerolineales bacterium]
MVIFILAAVMLGACAAAPASAGASKVSAAPIEFTGVIESVNGMEWVVDGQTITVEPTVIHDGPFVVGDTVKVEVEVSQDGTISVTRVELPSTAGQSELGMTIPTAIQMTMSPMETPMMTTPMAAAVAIQTMTTRWMTTQIAVPIPTMTRLTTTQTAVPIPTMTRWTITQTAAPIPMMTRWTITQTAATLIMMTRAAATQTTAAAIPMTTTQMETVNQKYIELESSQRFN